MQHLLKNPLVARYATLFLVFFVLSAGVYFLVEPTVKPENRPDFLNLITTNPLISAIFAALIVILPISAIQSATDRVKQTESKLDELKTVFDKTIDERIETRVKAAQAKAIQLEDKLQTLEREHEWLRLLRKTRPYIDAKTAVSLFESAINLLRDGHPNFAYVWMSHSLEDDIEGDPASFEALAHIAIVFFDDTYLANKFMALGASKNALPSDHSIILQALLAYSAGTITQRRQSYERITAEIVPDPIYYPSQLRLRFSRTKTERLLREFYLKWPVAYAISALYLHSLGDLDRLIRLTTMVKERGIALERYPFAKKLLSLDLGENPGNFDEKLTEVIRDFSRTSLDQRSEFLEEINSGDYPAASLRLSRIVQAAPVSRLERIFQIWFSTTGNNLLKSALQAAAPPRP